MALQSVVFGGLGHPWIHRGITCDECGTSPIEGYRYKCEKCNDHDLCERCFRKSRKRLGHKFVQVARDSSEYRPPFQIYYIVCHECGQAPIEGRCHRHKWRPNLYLCDSCFSQRPHSGNTGAEWEVFDEPRISTLCRTHGPVFHFHRHCESCGISPISGPRFDALEFPEFSFCLICFDSRFVKGQVKNEDYLRVEKPEAHRVRQIFAYSCQSCGELPIDGPAYVSKRLQDHALCLLCYMNIPRQQQLDFSRVDAPSQYGDPPLRSLPQVTAEMVSAEEYSLLAAEFEQFKVEKEAAARLVASNLLTRAEELERLRKELEEVQRAGPADAAGNVGRSEETSEITKLQADYTKLAAALEQLQIEKEEAVKVAADYTDLSLELERRKVEGAEAVKVSTDYALQLKEQNEASAQVKTQYDNLAQELLGLKVAATDAARSKELEHTNLVQELERLKQEAAEAANVAADSHRALLTENERLKAEKDEAVEYASLFKELDGLEGEPEMKTSEEFLLLQKECEELREERITLAGELASVKERAEAAAVDAERHSRLQEELKRYKEDAGRAALLLQDHSRLAQELETLKEMKGQELSLRAEEHSSLLQEFDSYKQERGELEMSRAQAYADVVQRCEKLLEDKAWLIQEVENMVKENDEVRKISSDNESALKIEIESLREEMDSGASVRVEEHADLVQQCNNLTREKEATEVMHDSLLRRFEKLQSEKEEESRSRTVEFTSVLAELERLKEENEDIRRTRSDDQRHLHDEIARLDEEKEEALRDSANRCIELEEELDRVRNEMDRELRSSNAGHVSAVEEFETFKREKGEAGRKLEEEYFRVRDDLEHLQREKEEMARENSDLAQRVEVLKEEIGGKQRAMRVLEEEHSSLLREAERLRGEKEAEASLVSNLALELDKLESETEAYKREHEESGLANTEERNKLREDLEKLQRESAKELKEKDELYFQTCDEMEQVQIAHADQKKAYAEKISQLARDVELIRAEKDEKVSNLSRELELVRAEEEKKVSNLSREIDSIRAEKEEKEKAIKEESSSLRDEVEKFKSFAFLFDMPDIGRCAQVAISTCGAMVRKKKQGLEAGYAKSNFSKGDHKILKEAEKFLADAAKELDDEYDNFHHEARLITDAETSAYYSAHFRPAQLARARIDSHHGIAELANVRKKFGR